MNFKKLFLFTVSLLLASCAAKAPSLPADNLISPSFRQPPAASLIVLLPAKVAAAELQPGAAMLMNALHRRLTAAGYKVVALGESSNEAIWSQEVEAVGGIYDQTTGALRPREMLLALGRLAQRVSTETHAAIVMRPQLTLRKADISGASATWDGQQRRLPIVGASGDMVKSEGTTLGLSVGLDIFAASGELVMQTHGGALLPYRMNVQSGIYEVRPDLFANAKDLADGVALALTPFIKM